MAVGGLLQLQQELGICRNPRSSKQLKYSLRRGDLRLPATGLSPAGQNLFAIQFLESIIKKPKCSIPVRYKSLCCRASLFGVHITNSGMKTVSTAFTSPSFTKLAAAIGVVAFALWGLEPLVQSSRNLYIHKNDNNWRKTSARYALTSYVQPVLLWTGAMLVCRAMDPVYMPTDASRLVKQRLLTFMRSLSTVLSFAYCLSCAIQQAQKSFMQTPNPSDARNMGFEFAGKAVYTAVWVAAVSLFMELLGFSAQKWLTAGGLGTVLLTLAGREIFTNFLSSIMIHATRPFVLSEWIQTTIEGYEVSGFVEQVGWWSPTIIRGEDREAIHIPNHKFTVNVVRNLTQKTHWRVKTHLAISHLDVNKINNIVADMRKVIAKNPQIEQQRLHRRVFLDIVDPENQAFLILVSCFVKTSHHEEYLCVKEAILLDLLRVISHHGARLATPIRTIQRVQTDADVENIPFSSGAASRRPFLLIEPAYKINGEDRSKPPRPARAARDQDNNRGTGQQSTTNSKVDSKLKGKPASELKSQETSKPGATVDATNADAQKDADFTAIPVPKADDKQTVKPPVSTSISEKESKVSDTVVKNQSQ